MMEHPVILASGFAGGVAFRDRVLFRRADGSYADLAGEVHVEPGELTNVRELDLVAHDVLADLNDSYDPWDLRLQLRSIPNAVVTRQLSHVPDVVPAGEGPRLAGRCCDAPSNPWFEPTTPSDDRFIPIIRSGYYGVWRHVGFRIRLLPADACQLIAYGDPSEAVGLAFTPTDSPDAPYVASIDQAELQALYTVEGRAVVDRHLVTICGSRPGVTMVTAQDIPEHERVRQIAAAARFLAEARGDDFAGDTSLAGVQPIDAGPSCNVAASRPLPATLEVDNREVRAIRMERTDFVRSASGWQGNWRERRPAIYLSVIPQF